MCLIEIRHSLENEKDDFIINMLELADQYLDIFTNSAQETGQNLIEDSIITHLLLYDWSKIIHYMANQKAENVLLFLKLSVIR